MNVNISYTAGDTAILIAYDQRTLHTLGITSHRPTDRCLKFSLGNQSSDLITSPFTVLSVRGDTRTCTPADDVRRSGRCERATVAGSNSHQTVANQMTLGSRQMQTTMRCAVGADYRCRARRVAYVGSRR